VATVIVIFCENDRRRTGLFGTKRPVTKFCRGTDVDATVKELAIISLVSCWALGLAWLRESDYLAMFFAVAATIAGVEAVRRSL
jgi:hypothetical protein